MELGMRDGAEMEMLLMEIPRGASPLFSGQRRPVEERPLEVEPREEKLCGYGFGRGYFEDGLVRVGCNHRGYASTSPIPQKCAAIGDADVTSLPRVGGDDGAAGVFRVVTTPSMEVEGVDQYDIPGYGALDDWNAAGVDQQVEFGLLRRLSSMGLGKEKDVAVAAASGNNPIDPRGIWNRRPEGTMASDGAPLGGPSPILQKHVAFSYQERASMVPQKHCHLTSRELQICLSPSRRQATPLPHPGGLCSVPINLSNNGGVWSDLQRHPSSGVCRNPYEAETQVTAAFSTDRSETIEEFLPSQEKSFNPNDQWDAATPPISPQTVLPNSPSGFSILAQQKGLFSNGYILHYPTPVTTPGGNDAFHYEDSMIIQAKELQPVASNAGGGLHKERKRSKMCGRLGSRVAPLVTADNVKSPGPYYLPFAPRKYESLTDILGSISLVANDQHWCRFLQHKYDVGTEEEKEMIFNEIIDHVPELMVNPFGNYLMQKVLDVCTEKQRWAIILILTKVPNELVRMSLNMHGTRAVQKLIEVLRNKKETALVISALQPGFLNLVMDANGNHVIQRCLQYFSNEQNKFIFDAAVRHCVDIATHRHGCCVLQRCIAHSTGQCQEKLLAEVSRNGLILAQNAFGNYAVQYIIDMKNSLAIENLKSEFKGNYAQLSMQKFSSNVVEKCLCVFDEVGRRMIVSELLSVTRFDHLMQDPFANYVIQSALLLCKGPVHTSLVKAIRSHAVLRANPYCKGIFNLLKK